MLPLSSASTLDQSNSGLTKVPSDPEPGVERLLLKQNAIKELDDKSFINYPELTELDLAINPLETIRDGTFNMLFKLEIIDFTDCEISKLPSDFGPSTTNLREISVWAGLKNQDILTYPYFAAFTRLDYFNIGGNNVDIHGGSVLPPNTRSVTLHYVQLDTFPQMSQYTPNVAKIYMNGNRLGTIPQANIQGLTEMEIIQSQGSRIINFPNFSHCLKLQTIDMLENEITNIPRGHISGLVSIIEMELSKNKISDMPDISDLTTLEEFLIGFNQISVIPDTYLSGLPNMKTFDCRSNRISVVANIAQLLPQLRELYVQSNQLTTLPDLYDMTSITKIYAGDNPYVCDHRLCWLRMLPWMRSSVTILQDDPVCADPPLANGTRVVRYHPATMECYTGMYVITT